MRFSRRRGRREALALNADINLTNLVDVALVLLIIFMITAPILQGGIDVQLPRAEAAAVPARQGVIVSVRADGRIYIADVPVSTPEEFRQVYPRFVRQNDIHQAYLKGDERVPYGRVLEVLGMMKKLDVAEVGLVAEPVQQKGK